MEEQVNNSKSELFNLSLRDLFYKYVRFLPLIVLSVAFALLIAFLYLRYSIPQYNVAGSMLIKSEQPGNSNRGLEDILGGNKVSNIQNEIEVLKSRPLMQRVVDSLHLQFSYKIKGKIKAVNIYTQGAFIMDALEVTDSNRVFTFKVKFLNNEQFRINDDSTIITFGKVFKNQYGVFRLLRNPGTPVGKEYSVTWTPSGMAAVNYAGAIQVVPKSPGTGILVVGMRTTNSQMGADIINKLMEEYAQYSVEEKNKTSDQTLAFITDRIGDIGRRIDSMQRILIAFEKRNNLIDSKAQSERIFDIIGEADKLTNEQTLKLSVTDMLSGYLQSKDNRYSKVPTTFNIDDITLNELVAEYNRSQILRQQLLDGNVPVNNPRVVEESDKIEKLRTSIQENLRNIRSSISTSIARTRNRSAESQASLETLPENVKEQLEMQRVVDGLEGLMKLLTEERERQGMIKAANVPNSAVVNYAYPTSTPVKPNRRSIQILAVLIGLGLPVLLIFIAEILNDKVSTRFDVEKITMAPILGEIGHSYSNTVLVVSKTTRSMVAEQFRIIRSNLQYVLNKKEKSTILITSSFSGEGKSYISTNMGAVLALAGKKTIILEFDIRKPKILSGLGLPKGPGITNYLIGKAELKDVIKPVPDYENLFVLGCGPIPPNPSELLLDERVNSMFDWLQANFDVVLVDTAPVGMVSDAMTLGKFADTTLYLVRQGHTFKKQVALIDEFYKEEKLPRLSIIINDVKMKAGYGYYGYGRYGYGYGYGYGSYYEEEAPPPNFIERIFGWLDFRRLFKRKKN